MVKALLLALLFVSTSTWAASSDKVRMNKARGLYEKGKLNEAITIYSKIEPSSDFWLESLEERAWAYTRQGQYEKALADLQSITSPVWSSQVGPETYMLSTFVSLKICAYKDVLKKIALFKKVLLPRVETLQTLIDRPMSTETWEFLKQTAKTRRSMSSLGTTAEQYPRYFFRDDKLLSFINQRSKEKTEARLKDLARIDLTEIETNLKKMKIIDVELIQNVLTMDKNQKASSKKLAFEKVDKNKNLIFPVTDEEVWVDEVGHFQVKAENCPYYQGASL